MVVLRRTGNKFAADVGAFRTRMKDRTKIVWQESILSLVEYMQRPVSAGGNMPVVTGFLRSSLMASTAGVPPMIARNPGGSFSWDMGQVEAVVRGAKVGQKISLGYTAVYADRLEYGWSGRPGYGFQRLAVQRWPSIVAQTIARLKRTGR